VSPRATAACKHLLSVLTPTSSATSTGATSPSTEMGLRACTWTKSFTSRRVAGVSRILPGMASAA
jgi:hypothetical protein